MKEEPDLSLFSTSCTFWSSRQYKDNTHPYSSTDGTSVFCEWHQKQPSVMPVPWAVQHTQCSCKQGVQESHALGVSVIQSLQNGWARRQRSVTALCESALNSAWG